MISTLNYALEYKTEAENLLQNKQSGIFYGDEFLTTSKNAMGSVIFEGNNFSGVCNTITYHELHGKGRLRKILSSRRL